MAASRKDIRGRTVGAIFMLILAVAAVIAILMSPRNDVVEVALVMVPILAVGIAFGAWRLGFRKSESDTYELTSARWKFFAYGGLALVAIIIGAVVTVPQSHTLLLVAAFLFAAQLTFLLFDRLPGRSAP